MKFLSSEILIKLAFKLLLAIFKIMAISYSGNFSNMNSLVVLTKDSKSPTQMIQIEGY
jgi:hypothetical protein